jgi:MFS transporter, ACS family, allantoate permease
MERMIEALLDPKTWLFALAAALNNIPNSLSNQLSLVINSFGFTTLQTTLLTCISGLVEIVTIFTGVNVVVRFKNARGIVGIIYYFPAILGVLLITILPWSNKAGLLAGVYLTGEQTLSNIHVISSYTPIQ